MSNTRVSPAKLNDSLPQKEDTWTALKQFTDARIALGRAGVSLPTSVQLQFNVDHAHARDAVNVPLNTAPVIETLEKADARVVTVQSRAGDRRVYLQRPDLGRRLNSESVHLLTQNELKDRDITIVLVDGLSSVAVQKAGAALALSVKQKCLDNRFTCTDIVLVEQGRVAIGDEIGQLLKSKMVVLIVGERPGLSSPDSLGIYFTFAPQIGLTDARRNCISNIRPSGLSIDEASSKTLWLIRQAEKINISGVQLKDNSVSDANNANPNSPDNFLLPMD